jgi:hypothetical protein
LHTAGLERFIPPKETAWNQPSEFDPSEETLSLSSGVLEVAFIERFMQQNMEKISEDSRERGNENSGIKQVLRIYNAYSVAK